MSGGVGSDSFFRGDGTDTVNYRSEAAATQGATINLETGVNSRLAAGDTFDSIENVFATRFADNITGNAGNNVLTGNEGDDVLRGGAGNDTLLGGAAQGADGGGAFGNDTLDGGDGIDTANYRGDEGGGGVSVNLLTGAVGGVAQGDTLISIENVSGTRFNDSIGGDAANNVLQGNEGDDTLVGSAFDDTLTGAAGANLIAGGGGDDTLADAAGNDTLLGGNGTDGLDGGDGWDTLEGEAGDDQLAGGAGGDILRGGAGADHLAGGADYDTASYWDSTVGVTINLQTGVNTGGTAQGDTIDDDVELIHGSNHDDVMTGNALSNGLIGFDGDDTLSGSGGNDVVRGGSGADTLNGGTGADVFSYTAVSDSTASAADTIQDFLAGTDVISVQAIDADGNAANGDTAFSFIGTAAFSSTAGQLRYESAGGSTTVSADVNGDGTADLVIHLDGAFTLQAADFLL